MISLSLEKIRILIRFICFKTIFKMQKGNTFDNETLVMPLIKGVTSVKEWYARQDLNLWPPD